MDLRDYTSRKVEINSLREAVLLVKKHLHRIYYIDGLKEKYVNKKRHCLITIMKPNQEIIKFIVLFKRAFFGTYSQQFDTASGLGESINKSCLEAYKKMGVDTILYVYPDKKIYSITVDKFINMGYGNNYIRKQKSGEVTVHIPISMLKRWA